MQNLYIDIEFGTHFTRTHVLGKYSVKYVCVPMGKKYMLQTAGNIEASTVVFASATVTLPWSRPRMNDCAAEVKGPWRTREGAAAPPLVRPDLGQTRE